MFRETRKEKIIDLLNKEKEYKVVNFCKYFNLSLATIHRDLNELKREGRIKKVHGGVLLINSENIESRNTIRLKTNVVLKQKIAIKALEFIENEDCLFLDNSTTCFYLAKEISESIFKDIVIVTNSYSIPGLFKKNKNIQVVSTGGLLFSELDCFIGSHAISTINKFNCNKFFFSSAAISIDEVLSDMHNQGSDEVKKEMFNKTKHNICLVDSTKFNLQGQCRIFSLTDVKTIITDDYCSDNIRKNFARIKKKLIIA